MLTGSQVYYKSDCVSVLPCRLLLRSFGAALDVHFFTRNSLINGVSLLYNAGSVPVRVALNSPVVDWFSLINENVPRAFGC